MSCYLCGGEDTETHHIVLRSECRPLEKCELNKVRLCTHCHDYLHHDSKGYKKLRALKFELQNKREDVIRACMGGKILLERQAI